MLSLTQRPLAFQALDGARARLLCAPVGSFPSSLPRNRLAMAHGVCLPCPFHSDAAESIPTPHRFPASLTIPMRVGCADSLILRRTRVFGQDRFQHTKTPMDELSSQHRQNLAHKAVVRPAIMHTRRPDPDAAPSQVHRSFVMRLAVAHHLRMAFLITQVAHRLHLLLYF